MVDKNRLWVMVPALSAVFIVLLRNAHLSDFNYGFGAGVLLALSIGAVVKLKRGMS
jgi:hypothetical protein